MKFRTIIVIAALVAAIGITGVATFTSANLERGVSVTVQADDSGIVQLTPGEGAEIKSDELVINADGDAMNVNATFNYGDSASPASNFAFSVTNADDTSHNFTLTHNGPSSVTYVVHDGNGNSRTVSSGGSATFNSVSSGSTLYVTMTIQTPDTPQTQTGTITIDAE